MVKFEKTGLKRRHAAVQNENKKLKEDIDVLNKTLEEKDDRLRELKEEWLNE